MNFLPRLARPDVTLHIVLFYSFVTLNPEGKRAGRHRRIPDNLRLLFRPVATTVPDACLIAEVSLRALGFEGARELARRIATTFHLSAEQLSYRSHYEFGMRAVKAVVEAAAAAIVARGGFAGLNEAEIVRKAVVDLNLPKFVDEDVKPFERIVRDVFGEDEVESEREELAKAVEDACQKLGLQATEWFVSKVLQLYELLLVRHGVMIIGDAGSCKSSCYKLLAAALTSVEEGGGRERGASYRVINPKSVTMDRLYGCFDPETREWSDGLLGRTFR